jgi:hypothetical protein
VIDTILHYRPIHPDVGRSEVSKLQLQTYTHSLPRKYMWVPRKKERSQLIASPSLCVYWMIDESPSRYQTDASNNVSRRLPTLLLSNLILNICNLSFQCSVSLNGLATNSHSLSDSLRFERNMIKNSCVAFNRVWFVFWNKPISRFSRAQRKKSSQFSGISKTRL